MSTVNNTEKIHVVLYPWATQFEAVRQPSNEEIFQRAPVCPYTLKEIDEASNRAFRGSLDRSITSSARYSINLVHRKFEKFLATSWDQLMKIILQLREAAAEFLIHKLDGGFYAIEAYDPL